MLVFDGCQFAYLHIVPSWQDVVCNPGSVWGVGWGNCCSSHSVHCGPYFLGEFGTAEPARPGPLSDYWAPSWAYVKDERNTGTHLYKDTTRNASQLHPKMKLFLVHCMNCQIAITSWFWKWNVQLVYRGSGHTRFQSRPVVAGSLTGPAAAGSSALVASPTPSAGL